ncbi:quinone oxidoreductase family protein [Lacticaseibacillus yichunensis]|uniref:Zinc-binding alcohol dehydrogenase family protein n=1 Tax=Lacticaseibacillus yichunensis TaxID=2486015 RepID=A0ABW4CNC4_9LACO|nr:zinc-binding alcohol dehydrogenase family protein [Lacticaseibacillus yichunensis]
MKAAILQPNANAPVYATSPEVQAQPGETVVSVLASAVSTVTRARAAGTHYSTSAPTAPLIPGMDGVGRTPDGQLVYFMSENGALAEQVAVPAQRLIALPAQADTTRIAASMNPAMASWMALTTRLDQSIEGASVLILGATGQAGRAAIQISRHFGAQSILAAGRNADVLATLPALGATQTLQLETPVSDEVQETLSQVDVVLDFLWGTPAQTLMSTLLTHRASHAPLTWLEIGSIAGQTLALPAVALRSRDFTVRGSGIGSVGLRDYLKELPRLAAYLTSGEFLPGEVNVQPLNDVQATWQDTTHGRLVYLPEK